MPIQIPIVHCRKTTPEWSRQSVYLWMIGFSIVLLFMLAPVPTAAATGDQEGIPVFSVSQTDLNGNGRPDLTVIDCAFATDNDRITVLDQGGDMPAATDWQAATDFHNDIWLYDIGADGSIQLIVVYQVEDGHETAYIYDDEDGDGRVSYQQVGTEIIIRESQHWSARITSGSTWRLPDGRLNLNLKIELDGVGEAAFVLPAFLVESKIKRDGEVDVEFEQVAGSDGIVRYALLRLLTPFSTSAYYIGRSAVWSNEGLYATMPFVETFFPFLPANASELTENQSVKSFGPPAVDVDWSSGKLLGVHFKSWHAEQAYACTNHSYIVKGEINDVSHECPLANYDLADNDDGYPELNLRMFYNPPGDIALPSWLRPSGKATQEIYYSWSQSARQALRWDYKLGLAGDYTIDSVEWFSDFALRKVPFDEFPAWVTDRPWKLTTFVARENREYISSEGIWEWNPLYGVESIRLSSDSPGYYDVGTRYMMGESAVSPASLFKTIDQGFRGEINFASPAKAQLYLSPVDRKLHLLGAQSGVWNVNDTVTIEYIDRNDDGYMDEWQFLEDGLISQQLNILPGYLLYSGHDSVVLRQAVVPNALFESAPPNDHASWVALGEKLETYQHDFAPDDFTGLLAQFAGPTTEIQGAVIHDLRTTSQGFRFVLELQPGFHLAPDQKALLPLPTAPGSYVVEFADQVWSLQPATPGAPRVSAVQFGAAAPEALHWTTLEMLLHNDGLEDVHDLPLCLTLEDEVGRSVIMTDTVALLPGAGEQRIAWEWAPPAAGPWQVQVAAYCDSPAPATPGGNVLATAVVQVAESDKPSAAWLVFLGDRVPRPIALLLLAAVGMAGMVATIWLRRSDL